VFFSSVDATVATAFYVSCPFICTFILVTIFSFALIFISSVRAVLHIVIDGNSLSVDASRFSSRNGFKWRLLVKAHFA